MPTELNTEEEGEYPKHQEGYRRKENEVRHDLPKVQSVPRDGTQENPLKRTFLLLQGTIWGVAVAIFPTAVLEGTRAAAVEEARAYGVDRVAVVADPTS